MGTLKCLLVGFVVSASLSTQGLAQDVCQSVLQGNVFNTTERGAVVSYASNFRAAMCDVEWRSEEDISSRARGFGFSFSDISRDIGLNSTSVRDDSSRREAFRSFCSRTSEQIGYGSQFFERYRNTDASVRAWSDCVLRQSEGSFLLVNQDVTLTGAILTLQRRSQGSVPALDVNGIESVPLGSVECFANGVPATEASFDASQREAAISCRKRADEPVTFILDTNWGVFGPIALQGFSLEVEELRRELARVNSDLRQLQTSMSAQLQDVRSNFVTNEYLAGQPFVRFGVPLSIHDHQEQRIVVSRHSGGPYMSPYPEGQALGARGSITWTLRPR